MKVIIDGDIFRYQYGSVEMAHPFLDGEFVPASSEHITYLVEQAISDIVKETKASSYIVALSGRGNFRNQVASLQPYKGNRDPNSTRPYHYDTVGDYIVDNHPHVVVDGMEADDWLGIEQRKDLENTCIASRDKDLMGVPGYHYRFACGAKQPAVPMHWVSEFEATHFFFYQMLIGDNTDNIPGCGKKEWVKWGTAAEVVFPGGKVVKIPKMMQRRKGVGSKTALKLLEPCLTTQDMYDVISTEYKVVYGDSWKEAMLENARLLYIGQTPSNLFNWGLLSISYE